MPAPAESGDQSWVALAALAAGGLALIGLAVLMLRGSGSRKRRPAADRRTFEEPRTAPPAAEPTALVPPPAAAPRITARTTEEPQPNLEIELTPLRAGTNLTSAAIDYRIVLRNTGAVEARDIAVGIYMLSASARQAADLQSIFAAPVTQPATAPFTLPAGADVQLSGIAMLPRENVNIMTIDGKPWFVPVLAMKIDYRWGENVGAPGAATTAQMIGIDRGEGAKMAPFRLDTGPHMHTNVSARRVA